MSPATPVNRPDWLPFGVLMVEDGKESLRRSRFPVELADCEPPAETSML